MKLQHFFIIFIALTCLTACGGGSSSNAEPAAESDLENGITNPPETSGENQTTWTSGVFEDESTFKDFCETPRTGTDPYNNNAPYPDQQGTTLDENNWLRSWSNNTYLWYDEIIDRDPDPELYDDSATPVTEVYFDLLKTEELTQSGTPKDNFHFTYPTDEWNALSVSGVSVSYGFDFVLLETAPPRKMVITQVDPNSDVFGELFRGDEVLEIDGVDLVNDNTQSGVNTLNNAISPSQVGQTHEFVVIGPNDEAARSVLVTATEFEEDTVPLHKTINTENGRVGYILFNAHRIPSEPDLVQAISDFSQQGVDELVLDLRYNGGGFLYIASQLAYMVAGSSQTNGKTFDITTFNDKHPTINPVTGQTIQPIPFYSRGSGNSTVSANTNLPSLNLSKVYVLSTANTCSASEAIINGLRGIDFEVVLIGDTTCGKPYGFYATDNCGTSYFTVQFSGSNEKGFGEYSDGFTPNNKNAGIGEFITGCYALDDYYNQLGDENEGLLSVALSHIASGVCPAAPEGVGKYTSNLNRAGNDSGLAISDNRPSKTIFGNKLLNH